MLLQYHRCLLLLTAGLLLAGTACGPGSVVLADPQTVGQGQAADRKPLEIGKLIKKRQIAPVMSVAHADWLTRPERDAQEQPDRVVAELNIPTGATVVDLGAGVGYFTWRLAKQVGPSGKVIAVDIQEGMLELLRENLEARGVTNTEVVLGSPENPRLPLGKVDLVLLVDVYHELAHPEQTMEHVRRSLKPGGRVAIIEYRKEDPSIPISPLHKMTVAEVRSELEPVGFHLAAVLDFLPTQHILIFQDARGHRR
jgi:predicted methyltransferase